MELKRYKLGEICPEFHAGNGIQSSQIKGSGLYPVFGGNGLRGYTDTFNQDGQYLIIGRQGAYCGNVRYNVGKAFLTEHAIVGQTSAEHNAIYLACKLSLMNLAQFQGQSAQPGLSVKNLSEIEILMPPKKIQDNIARVILNIDHKIALNRAINQNLEAMAKQLYDYWFVQFDFPNEDGKPYKSSGGEMVWNEKLKREIPKGWNVLKLGEHCSFNKRTSNGYFNHPILYLDTSNITNNTIDELQFLNPSSDIIPSRARRLVQEGDIVYSTVRPNLKHFGIIMNPDYNMVVSTGFAVITANWSAYRYFIYQFLTQAATVENLSTIAQSAVSAYPSINTSDIENLDLVVPPDSMIEKYAKTACRLYLQIDTNYKEIKSLTKQRDELLPLLMNGQVSVNSDLSVFYIVIFKYYASSVN